jgi:predicted ATPase
LHISSERTLEVLPLRLAPRDSYPAPDPVSRYEALQLFVERARDVQPDFSLTSASSFAVAEICQKLDGLPLAIELAAARVKHVAVQALPGLLEQRLSVLTGGARDLPPRQQTLRSAIAWSYDLLRPGEQAIFRRMAIFAGGCTLEAAEAVCTLEHPQENIAKAGASVEVLNRLASLIDKSLLRYEPSAAEEPRYVVLETVREYGMEQLSALGEKLSIQERHARYYADLAERAAPRFLTAEQIEWLARMEDDLDNLRAALQWLLESNQYELGQRLLACLWYFWSVHCRVTEGREWLRRFLEDPGGQTTTALARARGYLALSFMTIRHDDAPANYAAASAGLALAREAGDPWTKAMALARFAYVAERMATRTIAQPDDDATCAVDVAALYEEALLAFRRLGDQWAIAQCLHYYARFLSSRDARRARTLLAEALDIARRIGERNSLSMALATLANLELDAKHDSEARRLVEESLALTDELDDLFNSSQRLGTLAQLAIDEKRFVDAMDLLERCMAGFQLLGNRPRRAQTLHNLALAARMAGDADRALEAFDQSCALFRELNLHAEVGAVMASLGHLQRQLGAIGQAAETFGASAAILTGQGSVLGIPTVLSGLGRLALDSNRPSDAARLLAAAEALVDELESGPQGALNTSRASLRGYQLRRDRTHVHELATVGRDAFSDMSDGLFEAARDSGRVLTSAEAVAAGLNVLSLDQNGAD